MGVREEERRSAEQLKRYLQDEHGIEATWEGVDPDPPDLRVTIRRPNGSTEAWAVEVTGLFQYIDWEGNEVTRRVFEPAIFRVCEKLNDELSAHMKSSYFLNVTGPLDAAVFRDLERRVRKYIQSGKTEEEALDYPEAVASVRKEITADPSDPKIRQVIDRVAGDRVNLTIKASPGGNRIVAFVGSSGAARVPNSTELAAKVDATLDYTAKRILDQKLSRMVKLSGYDRKCLFIWSAVPFAGASEVADAFQSKTTAGLDGIFFAELARIAFG